MDATNQSISDFLAKIRANLDYKKPKLFVLRDQLLSFDFMTSTFSHSGTILSSGDECIIILPGVSPLASERDVIGSLKLKPEATRFSVSLAFEHYCSLFIFSILISVKVGSSLGFHTQRMETSPSDHSQQPIWTE